MFTQRCELKRDSCSPTGEVQAPKNRSCAGRRLHASESKQDMKRLVKYHVSHNIQQTGALDLKLKNFTQLLSLFLGFPWNALCTDQRGSRRRLQARQRHGFVNLQSCSGDPVRSAARRQSGSLKPETVSSVQEEPGLPTCRVMDKIIQCQSVLMCDLVCCEYCAL